jgi:hypothetical protein
MPTTPVYALRYPAATDPADVPLDIHNLATDVETALASLASGHEFAYAEITASVSVTATTEATAQTIVTAPAITLDGSTIVIIEFFAPMARNPAANQTLQFALYEGSSSRSLLSQIFSTAGQIDTPVHLTRRITPSAGAHTYSIRAFVAAPSGIVFAGPATPGNNTSAFIRITKV